MPGQNRRLGPQDNRKELSPSSCTRVRFPQTGLRLSNTAPVVEYGAGCRIRRRRGIRAGCDVGGRLHGRGLLGLGCTPPNRRSNGKLKRCQSRPRMRRISSNSWGEYELGVIHRSLRRRTTRCGAARRPSFRMLGERHWPRYWRICVPTPAKAARTSRWL